LIEGNKKTALKDLYTVVLSKDMAIKYFGVTEAVGKTIQLKINEEFENFTVTAIMENAPQNSTIKTGMLLPFKNYERYNTNQDWFGGSMNTSTCMF